MKLVDRKVEHLLPSIAVLSMLFLASPAHAALIVSEIMYNPQGANAGHQWIEVTNTGPDSIDLGAKDIRLFDASGNHLIKAYGSASTELAAGTVAIIAKDPLTFLNDYVHFSGILMKSSFSLPASSGIIGITQTDGEVLDKAVYSSALGAAGDGNSLQRVVGSASTAFTAAAPTPGSIPAKLPAPLAAPVKLSAVKTSSSKRTKKSESHANSQNNYGKGTLAPSAEAAASADGAPYTFPITFPTISLPFLTRLEPLLSSVWFAGFLGLLAFSTFSLILIQRTRYL